MHDIWFHLREVQVYTKLIYVDRNQNNACVFREVWGKQIQAAELLAIMSEWSLLIELVLLYKSCLNSQRMKESKKNKKEG